MTLDAAAAAGTENRGRLEAYVQSALREAARRPADAPELLRANAAVCRRHLNILARPARPPAHLQGLTAFDLAGAAERLEAAAMRALRHADPHAAPNPPRPDLR